MALLSPSTSLAVGDPVVSTERPEAGIGSLLHLGAISRVEYWAGPGSGDRFVVEMRRALLRKAPVDAGVEGFWFDGDRHRAVEVLRIRGGTARIRYPHGEARHVDAVDVRIPADLLLRDRTAFLGSRLSRPIEESERLRAWLTTLTEQDAACEARSAFLSSVIELRSYQLLTARRVLNDPVRRYILADEVGLGKTIEAGLIIRETLLDDADAEAIVVTPGGLVKQWQDELETKFLASDFGRRLTVTSFAQIKPRTNAVDLLVVDEAHDVAVHAFDAPPRNELYSIIRRLAHGAQAVLLLTATPTLHREDDLHGLLHLLDRRAYPLNDREGFRRRVERRDAIARDLYVFTPDKPAFFLEGRAKSLQAAIGDDPVLDRLVSRLVRAQAEGASAASSNENSDDSIPQQSRVVTQLVHEIRKHVADTHRLHRRVLRTRRATLKDRDRVVRGRVGPDVVTVDCPERTDALAVLDQWRALMFGRWTDGGELPASAKRLGREFARRGGSDLTVLGSLARLRSEEDPAYRRSAGISAAFANALARVETTEEELALLNELAELCSGQAGQHAAFVADHATRMANSGKVAVFSDFAPVCVLLRRALVDRLPSGQVVSVGTTDDQRSATDARRFLTDETCRIAICSPTARLGLNLQSADYILHADLPWSVLQLEQRIGRVDRYGPGGPVQSVVFCDTQTQSTIGDAWVRALRDGFEVFHRSISDLQHEVETENAAAVTTALVGGAPALTEVVAPLNARLAALRERIEHQELLDTIADDSAGDAFLARMAAVESAVATFASATADRAGLYGYGSAAVGGPKNGQFRVAIAPCARHSLDGLVDKHLTFDRTTAVETPGVRLLRVGNALIEALRDEVARDWRGRAWLQWKGGRRIRPEDERLFFVFDVWVGPGIDDRRGGVSAVTTQRAFQLLPPRLVQVAVSAGGVALEEDDSQLLREADEESDIEAGGDTWPLERVIAAHDWPQTCEHAATAAAQLAVGMLQSTNEYQIARDQLGKAHLQATVETAGAIFVSPKHPIEDV